MKKIRAIVLFVFYGCAVNAQESANLGNQFFYIDIFGCEYPVPLEYILNTSAMGMHFYIRDQFEGELSRREFRSGIDILDYDSSEDEPGFLKQSVYKIASLELFKISKGDYESYHLTDGNRQIFFSGEYLSESELISLTDICVRSMKSD